MAVPPENKALQVNARLVLPDKELVVTCARSGGPGGQNVNKVASKVVLRFSIRESPTLGSRRRALLLSALKHRLTKEGELLIHASRFRDRIRNEEDARERLAELLRVALQQRKTRRATRPTRSSKERRLTEKRRKGDRKRDRRSSGRGEEG